MSGTTGDFEIPRATISRLVLYLRELQQLTRRGLKTVRSQGRGNHWGWMIPRYDAILGRWEFRGNPGSAIRSSN